MGEEEVKDHEYENDINDVSDNPNSDKYSDDDDAVYDELNNGDNDDASKTKWSADAMHEQNAKKIKADNSKWDNNWDEINKQRQSIKASKEQEANDLKLRNAKKK